MMRYTTTAHYAIYQSIKATFDHYQRLQDIRSIIDALVTIGDDSVMSRLRTVILTISLIVTIGGLTWFVVWTWGLSRSDGIAAASLAVSVGSLLVGVGAWRFPVAGGSRPPQQELSGDRSIGVAASTNVVVTGDGNVVELNNNELETKHCLSGIW